jgi:hypothetical protein
MLLVIAGAGASYDSAPDHPTDVVPGADYRPPLANELFGTREHFLDVLDRLPECWPIIPVLRPTAQRPIEAELERLQLESETNPSRHRQLAAVRFYLQRMLTMCVDQWYHLARGVTNHLVLLDAIRHQPTTTLPTCIVTFNYDLLIEKALPEVGVQIRGLDDYTADPNYKLIKLHGSVDWAHEIETTIPAVERRDERAIVAQIIAAAPNLKVRPEYRYAPGHPAIVSSQGPALFPALAIPVVRKQRYECPPTHVEVLQQCLPNVRKILIIGWRGQETHFLDLLRMHLQRNVRAMAVCGNGIDGAAVLNHLDTAGVVMEARDAFDGGFSQFILSAQLNAFLSR